jgi:hypothetical protein
LYFLVKNATMLDNIMLIYDKNFGRLNNLITLYSNISTGRGRKPTSNLDLLRATIVLIHSTLEDFLRSLMIWKMPNASIQRLNQIPLFGTSPIARRTKFELGELIPHRNRTINEVINLSINEYLNSQSFNSATDVANALIDSGIAINPTLTAIFPALDEMIKRRHNIVHQADRDLSPGSGHHAIKSISLRKVILWKIALDRFAQEVISQL